MTDETGSACQVGAQVTQPVRPRPWVRTALVAVAWLAVIVAVVASDQTLDHLWDSFADRVYALYFTAYVLSDLVRIPPIVLGILLIARLDRRLGWRFLKEAAVVLLTQMVLCSAIKQLFGRMRPFAGDEATIFIGPNLRDASFSFPSGHATAAFALAALMSSYYPRWRYVFLLTAAAVALARVQLDRHFFGDVLAGGVLGWYWASWLVGWLGRCWGPRSARRRPLAPEAAAPGPPGEG